MHIYQDLVNKMMKQLGFRRVTGSEFADDGHPILASLSPIVTISRDPGSGGKPIAQKVAERLGFVFYDENLVAEIAKSAKMRRSLLDQIDEKGRSLMTDFVHNMFNPDYVSDIDYLRHLCKVVLSISYKGKAVILGRGANFIAPAASALRVHITAPERVRLRRAVAYEGYSMEQAREINRTIENDRKEFVKQYFGERITNPAFYDLMLDTTYYNLDQATSVIVHAFKQKFARGTM